MNGGFGSATGAGLPIKNVEISFALRKKKQPSYLTRLHVLRSSDIQIRWNRFECTNMKFTKLGSWVSCASCFDDFPQNGLSEWLELMSS